MPETAVIGSFFVDEEGICIACEQRVARAACAEDADRLIGRPFRLSGLDENKLSCALQRARAGESPACIEAELEGPETGTALIVCLRRPPSFPKPEGQEVIEGVVIDVTELRRENQELRRAVERKDTLLREVHHRVKNNLQVISSLLGLHASGSEDEVVRAKLRETQDRVNTIAIIHETLYQSEDLAQVNLPLYIDRLVGYLRSVYAEHGGQIEVAVEVRLGRLDMEIAVPCGLILSELVSNCFKHAFPDGRQGRILIQVSEDRPGEIQLVVADTGVGIAQEYVRGRSRSLGLRLVRRLVRQLGGSIEVRVGEGTSFLIRLRQRNR